MFEIGDEVICIDDTLKFDLLFSIARDFKQWIKKGQKYTIRDILYNDGIVSGILLKERHNDPIYIPLIGRIQEPAFATWRFAKAEENEAENFEEFVEEVKERINKNDPFTIVVGNQYGEVKLIEIK